MMSIQIFATRFVLALVFGALIGLEREWRQRMAGNAQQPAGCEVRQYSRG
jgi:uncharacterized membrane protein YhiD involved in acid resistance